MIIFRCKLYFFLIMSDDESSPPTKRRKSETTSDLEISPILTDSYQDKSNDFTPDTKVFKKKTLFN